MLNTHTCIRTHTHAYARAHAYAQNNITVCSFMSNNSNLPISLKLRILLDVARGVAYLHNNGVFHRGIFLFIEGDVYD